MRCGLCQRDVEVLCQSHIIPEHVYKKGMYKEVDGVRRCHGYVGVSGKTRFMQGGVKEKLLCKDCERLLSDKYESRYSQFWYRDGLLPSVFNEDVHVLSVDDYLNFKLYHLSVLYRCIISSQMNGDGLSLGGHTEMVRKSVLFGKDAESCDLFGFILVNGERSIERRIVIPPEFKRFCGAVAYSTVYAGCVWCFRIANHRSKDFEGMYLKKDGSMTMPVVDFRSLSGVRLLSTILNARD